MQTDSEFQAERDARERAIENNVRQINRNSDAGPLIKARLPFINQPVSREAASFRAFPIFGLNVVMQYPKTIQYRAAHGRGEIPIEMLPSKEHMILWSDLLEIASYGGNVYVVISYSTVIAWTRGIANAGELYVPDIDYSVATARHQKITKEAK